jgi:hypothetical protein
LTKNDRGFVKICGVINVRFDDKFDDNWFAFYVAKDRLVPNGTDDDTVWPFSVCLRDKKLFMRRVQRG